MPFDHQAFQPNEGIALDQGVNYFLKTQAGTKDAHWSDYDERFLVLNYSVGLDQILNGTDLATLLPDSWRCVLATGAQPAISCEVSIGTQDRPSVLISVCQDGCEGRLSDLRFVKSLVPADCELRMLMIPPLSIEVFWLKATAAGGSDSVVAVDLQGSVLPDRKLVPMDTFLDIVRPLAKRRLSFNDRIPQ